MDQDKTLTFGSPYQFNKMSFDHKDHGRNDCCS